MEVLHLLFCEEQGEFIARHAVADPVGLGGLTPRRFS